MGRLEQQVSAIVSSFFPTNISILKHLEREPFSMLSATTPGQIAMWGKGRISDAVWSSNSELLALGSALGVYIYDMHSLQLYCKILTSLPIQRVAFVAGDNVIATASDESVKVWDSHSGAFIRTLLTYPQPPVQIVFSPDANHVAIDTGESIDVYRLADQKLRCSFSEGSVSSPDSIAFAPDNRSIAVVSDGLVHIWHFERQQFTILGESSEKITSIKFTADGQHLFAVTEQAIYLWNVTDARLLRTFQTDLNGIWRAATSPDQRLLVAATDQGVYVWRMEDARPLRVIPTHQRQIMSLSFAPTSCALLAASSDGLQVWRIEDWAEILNLSGHWDSISSVAMAADGHTFAAIGREVALWQVKNHGNTMHHSYPIEWHDSHISGATFAPNSKCLAVATDTHIQLLSVPDVALLHKWNGGLAQANGILFSNDGHRLLSVSTDAIKIRHLDDHGLQRNVYPCNLDTYTVAFAPDGETLATVTDKLIQIWSVNDDTLRDSLQVTLDVNDITLTSGGSMLAIASDQIIELWCVDQSRHCYTLESGAQHLAFTANGEMLASSWNTTLQIWNVLTGSLLHIFTGHTDNITSIVFSEDGRMVLSGSQDGTVRLWSCQPHS